MKKYFVTMTLTWTGDIEATDEEQAESLAVEKFAEEADEQEFEIFVEKKLPEASKGASQ